MKHLEGQQLKQPWDPCNRKTSGEGGRCKNNIRKFPRLKKGQRVSRRMNECNLFQGKSLENLGTPGKTKDSKCNERVCVLSHFNRVQLLVTPWTVTPAKVLHPWDSSGKNTGVWCHSLLQGIFPTTEIEPRSPALKADSLPAEIFFFFNH